MGVSSPADGSTRRTYHRARERSRTAALWLVAVVWWLVVWFRPARLEIRGESMAPTLLDGDRALATRPLAARRGDVVVVEHPGRPGFEMVKRITAVPGDLAPDGRVLGLDEFWVEGDDRTRSTDSRHYGPVGRDLLKARVWLVYGPWSRRGLLRSRAVRA